SSGSRELDTKYHTEIANERREQGIVYEISYRNRAQRRGQGIVYENSYRNRVQRREQGIVYENSYRNRERAAGAGDCI
ncbi:hypothetical protein, partial [Paenibacillus fonticola]|uniref:hypothetical protein n=1 Tax=Paenibacillus fonticola TaxID=379896 RepID=UPI000475BAF0